MLRDTADRLESDLTCPPAPAPAATLRLPQAKKGPSVCLCPSLPAGCGGPQRLCSAVLASPFPLTSGFFFPDLQVWTIHPINPLATRTKSPKLSINRPTSSLDNNSTGAPPYRLAEKIQFVCRHHSPHESLQNTSSPIRPCRVPLSILSRRPPLIHPHFRCGLLTTVSITSNLPDHSRAVHWDAFRADTASIPRNISS